MAYTYIDHPLNHLVRLKSTRGLHSSTISQIQALKLELDFLRTFLRWTVKRCRGNENLLLTKIEVVVRNAGRYLQPLRSDRVKDMEADLARLVPKVLENIKPLKPKIEQVHITVAKSSPSGLIVPIEEVEEFLNCVIENLDDLLSYRDSSTDPTREGLRALETKLRLMRSLLRFAATRCFENEKLKDLCTHAESVAVEAAYLSFMCSFDPINEDIKEKISQLLRKIEPTTSETRGIYVGVIQALRPLTAKSRIEDAELACFIDTLQEYLVELLNDQPSWMASFKFDIEVLHDELIFLSSFVTDPPMRSIENGKWKDPVDDAINDLQMKLTSWGNFDAYPSRHYAELPKLKGQVIRIEDLAVEVGYAIFSYFFLKKLDEDMLEEARNALEDLLGKTKQIKEEVQVPLLTLPDVNMTRTDDLGFITSLLRNLRQLLDRQAGPVAPLKRQVQGMVDELKFLNCFLNDRGEACYKEDKLKNLATHIVRVSHAAEYVIDSFLVRDGPLWYHSLCLADVIKEMKHIRTEVEGVVDKKTNDTERKIFESLVPTGDTIRFAARDYNMVGFEDDTEKLIYQLISGSPELCVISIVGMAGLGKTTLAKRVYNDRSIMSHFDVLSFICVSQVYSIRELLLEILYQIAGDKALFGGRASDELMDRVRKMLIGKRYLIVMDDVCNVVAWDDLRLCFPQYTKGSRILLTTRSREVASHIDPLHIYPLRFLTARESWKLFQMRTFGDRSCPPQLFEVGMQIVDRCQRLPLAIVLVAGIIQKDLMSFNSWKQVLESQEGFWEQSYKNLPDCLRQCFLYFGAFQLNEEIPASKLISLWAAEGFIQQTKEKNLEDVALDYLMDLVELNLITVCRSSLASQIKSCKIQNSLHDSCVAQAKQENVFQLMDRYAEVSIAADGLDHGIDPNNSNIPFTTYEHRRLCISSIQKHFISSRVSGPLVRSLLLTGRNSNFSWLPCDVSFLSENFKLLKVLDLTCINVGSAFPLGLEKMILLRYLALRGEMNSIPSSIVNLQQLETFVTIGLSGEVAIPDTIWNLTNLRHLHIDDRASFGALDYRQEISQKLPNLRTMSTPFLSYGEDSVKLLRRFESLEKLKCIFLESWDSSRRKNVFPRLDILQHLHSLKLFYYGRKRESCEFSFPSTLRRLTLSRFCLPWDQISVIGTLPNLEILKLLNKAFEGSVWKMRDGEFSHLKLLKLDTLNLEEWNASEDTLPSLVRLELHKCKKLKEIPTGFGDITTLQGIEVKWCSGSVEDSALEIKKYYAEMTGEDVVKVIISKS